MDRTLLDTDIFSEVLKKKDRNVSGRARAYRARYGQFTLSAATVMEIVWGLCRLDAEKQLGFFLDSLAEAEVLPIDSDIAILAGRIDAALSKAGERIGINDVLIAATAIQYGLTLITGNLEHYDRFRKLGYPVRLDNWRGDSS